MRYLSVCSGIEAATVAWHHLGWQPVAFSEIEPFPCSVLAHHYPQTPNWGDMTKWKEWPDAAIDLLAGGTPCQSFSVAGLRGGLNDPRGGLMLQFLGIANRYRPRWIVWENVPGVLSSNGGRDFGTFRGALGELGYGWAYRVLDAQWFGVAQRRRRVFVIGCFGDQRSAAQVLFERESVRRDTAPSRKAGERIAGNVVPSIAGSLDTQCGGGKLTHQSAANGHLIGAITARMFNALDSRAVEAGCLVPSSNMRVRKLMPAECEKLMGFPPGYTQVPYRGKPAADGPRYKALGNSMAVPCMAWIGRRIDVVSKLEGACTTPATS
jgi:DNA (cytosine-5)-methyltransferase 1